MNTFFVILFSVLTVAYAGIYSAKWPVHGEVPAELSLRSGFGIQWVDSSSQYSSTPEPAPSEPPYIKFEDFVENNVRSTLNPLEDSEVRVSNMKSVETPSGTSSRRSERRDIDSSKYIAIGSIYDESPDTKLEGQSQYKPKRVRSVTLVLGPDSNVQNTNPEVRETPISTSRTPNEAYYLSELRSKFSSHNLGYEILPVPNYYDPSGFPTYLDTLQSTLPPLSRLLVQRDQIDLPSYQTHAQNAPAFQFAAANANSNGIGNGAGPSSAAISQNYGGFQTASSWVNIDNTQSHTFVASLNAGNLQQNVALDPNVNSNGIHGSQLQNVAQISNQNGDGSVGNQSQNVAQTVNQSGDGSHGSESQNVGQPSNQNTDGSDDSQFQKVTQSSNQNGDSLVASESQNAALI